jgi:hypothetical protein
VGVGGYIEFAVVFLCDKNVAPPKSVSFPFYFLFRRLKFVLQLLFFYRPKLISDLHAESKLLTGPFS